MYIQMDMCGRGAALHTDGYVCTHCTARTICGTCTVHVYVVECTDISSTCAYVWMYYMSWVICV